MKNKNFLRITSLVIFFLIFPFQLRMGNISQEKSFTASARADSSFDSLWTLEGWFHIIWGDPKDLQGEGVILYLLQDAEGRSTYLDFSLIEKPFNELLQLNRKEVEVVAIPNVNQDFTDGGEFTIQEIRIQEDKHPVSEAVDAVMGSQPYISILCKFSDVTEEPQDLAFFQSMYANTFPGLDHYWRELSYDQIDLLGSDAVGWFTLPQPRDYYIYDMDADEDLDTDFDRLTTDCTAAADSAVYFPNFVGINMIFNADLDEHSYGGGRTLTLDSVTQGYGTTWIADWGYDDISVVEHEMGHSYGLPHSSAMYGDIYDNFFDVMSMDRQSHLADETYGRTGQHTISYHKDLLGWLTTGDIYEVPQDDTVYRITIERLALPQSTNHKMAKLPVSGTTRFYTLEVRQSEDCGYDANLYYRFNKFGLVIHEVDPSREEPAHVVDGDNNGPGLYATKDNGPIWVSPETFIDATDGIWVNVVSEGASSITVDVRISDPYPMTDCASQSQMPQASCEALVALYNNTDGPNWEHNFEWPGPEWPCRWYGIECENMSGDVLTIRLSGKDLDGTLPTEIGNLGSLQTLTLGGNIWLEGNIPPSLGSLSQLKTLDLSFNHFSGGIPPELGDLSNLTGLFLEGNQLTGSIPSDLGKLSKLQTLYLYGNELEGSIPTSFGNLTELSYLHLYQNQLSGEIPQEIFTLPKLDYLGLDSNALEGTIPTNIGDSPVQLLWLHNNKLIGEIPSSMVNLDVYSLDLGYNALQSSDAAVISFLDIEDPDWAQTQTIAPTNLQASLQGLDALLTWDSILYTAGGGYYEISTATTPEGPYTVTGTTTDKLASSYLLSGLVPGQQYFRVRTYTPSQSYYPKNDQWSLYTEPLAFYFGINFLPMILK